MDEFDQEVLDIKAEWTREAEALVERAAKAQRRHLEKRRDHLRSGAWVPRHQCNTCIRAILTLSPDTVCAEGRNGDQWWKR